MSLKLPKPAMWGALALALVWNGQLLSSILPPFSSHMLMHMVVVTVAAPLIAHGLPERFFEWQERWPWLGSAVVASMIEMVGVWSWHVPGLHHAARSRTPYFLAEQTTFLLCGVYLWGASWGAARRLGSPSAMAGVIGLLLTSMHMTLLGALIALARRPLYGHHSEHGFSLLVLSPLVDQQLGGIIMLFMGAGIYLGGGLWLCKGMLTTGKPNRSAS